MTNTKHNNPGLLTGFSSPKVWIVLIGLAITLLLSSPSVLAVYKCTDASGTILYSDVPCVSSQTQQDTYGSEGKIKSAPIRIDFGKTRAAQRIKATAILDSIRIDGRDCEWALKVDEKQIAKCLTFLQDMRPGGEFEQAGGVLSSLIKDATEQNESAQDYAKVTRLMQEIAEYSQFMQARLKTVR